MTRLKRQSGFKHQAHIVRTPYCRIVPSVMRMLRLRRNLRLGSGYAPRHHALLLVRLCELSFRDHCRDGAFSVRRGHRAEVGSRMLLMRLIRQRGSVAGFLRLIIGTAPHTVAGGN